MSKSIVFFCGGEGISELSKNIKNSDYNISYIVPISDNGGSSSEIIKHFGGPAIGDIRKRLTDISGDESLEGQAVHRLLTFRTDRVNTVLSENQWNDIVRGRSLLWENISPGYRYWILSDLIYFDSEIKLRARNFDFRNMNIGNCFFSGARMRMNSLEAAIFNFSRVAMIKNTDVIPVIDTNKTLEIGCILQNEKRIIGQKFISYDKGNLDKKQQKSLPSKIKKIFYLNDDHQEYKPQVNPHVVSVLKKADIIIYAMGSFWTSLMPSLILGGVGDVIASKQIPKLFILNGYPDRETYDMQAVDFVYSVFNALSEKSTGINSKYITHLLHLEGTPFIIDGDVIKKMEIEIVSLNSKVGVKTYDSKTLANYIYTIVSQM